VGLRASLLEVTGVRWLSATLIVVGSLCGSAHAQVPSLDPTGRSGEPPPLRQEEPKPPPPPVPILPPPPPAPSRERLTTIRVFVREIRVVGSTIFSPAEIAAVTQPYVNRELSAEDLEALRVALTRLYVDRGYINSGAVLPDQTISDGIVTYQIIEGRLTDIEVEGNRWFRPGYLRQRVRLGAGPPLNVNELQEQLQLLLEDQRIRRLNADLKPGLRPGEATLTTTVEERIPFRVWLDANNYQSPSVGAERGILTLQHQNLTGWGDVLTFQYGRSEGLEPLVDVRYVLPVTAYDTLLSLQYRLNAFVVVEETFRDLDIESTSEIYTIGLRHPIYRTLNTEVALEVLGERLSHETFLLDEPFSLSPGAVNGESVVTAVRTVQEALHRTQNQVLAFRSRLSWGVDVLDATTHRGDEPDSRFFAWLGQFQAVRRFSPLDVQGIVRWDLQLTPDRLMSLEQFAVGGRYSVRGYRENTFVRDNAFVASVEFRVPVVRNTAWADYVHLAPFFDYGRAWNTRQVSGEPLSISSVGVGLRWALTVPGRVEVRPQFEIYWGHALREIKTPGGDLQDDGIHFQFVLGLF
jgi:hemolysin activation/secretion protein